jgi:hypothetical protein
MINNGKAIIEKNFDGLSISIPTKKNWLALLFGTAWLGGWYFGFVNASNIIFNTGSENAEINIFMTIWLIGWSIGGLAVVTFLLWGFFGQEKFITNRNEIHFEKTIFGIGLKKRLTSSEVKNFRTEMVNESWFNGNRWSFWGLGPGKIKFDYGFKTYSFGLSVDEAESNYIVGLLKKQFKEE